MLCGAAVQSHYLRLRTAASTVSHCAAAACSSDVTSRGAALSTQGDSTTRLRTADLGHCKIGQIMFDISDIWPTYNWPSFSRYDNFTTKLLGDSLMLFTILHINQWDKSLVFAPCGPTALLLIAAGTGTLLPTVATAAPPARNFAGGQWSSCGHGTSSVRSSRHDRRRQLGGADPVLRGERI